MSVEINPYLVDWEILVKKWTKYQSLEFWYEALEEEEDWIQPYEFSCLSYVARIPHPSIRWGRSLR
ncbi:MAG: hypothetical protein QNJ37_20645 [Crocosphaera sp.]|nr:hypothetical protein [Crocosphaera sp.]